MVGGPRRGNRPRWQRRLPLSGWTVEESDPGVDLRLHSTPSRVGRAWLEITTRPHDDRGSRYTQRLIFVPRGVLGRMYRLTVWPLRVAALRGLARDVVTPG